jgi:multiple sugar transport system permease protein
VDGGTAHPAQTSRRKKDKGRKERWEWSGLAFSAPYVVVFVAGTILPLLYALYLGFFQTKMIGGTSFVGLSNYIQAFTDSTFWTGFGRVSIYAVIQAPLLVILALIAALVLDSGRIKHIAVPRILVFLPYAVPSVVAALMWSYIYGQDYGLVGQLFKLFGGTAPDLLSSKFIMFAIMNIVIWGFMGYNMLIYYSSLRTIPDELYEAARLDGASEMRIAWSIKIPAIKGSIVMTLVFCLIGAFQLFNEPNLLQAIAPDAINSSYTPNMYTYTLAFKGQNVNYAAAVSLVAGIVTMVVIGIVKFIGDKWSDND